VRRHDFSMFIVVSWFVAQITISSNTDIFMKAAERKAQRDWYKQNSGSIFIVLWISLRNILLDTRGQPPVPINRLLTTLLDMVKDATDPWLLFL
jgi:hypothetical protein